MICLVILFGAHFIASNKYTGSGRNKAWIYAIGKDPEVAVVLFDNYMVISVIWKVSGNIYHANTIVRISGIIYLHRCDPRGNEFKMLYIAWWLALVLTALATGLLYFIVRFRRRKLNT